MAIRAGSWPRSTPTSAFRKQLAWADLLPLFGQQPLREIDTLFELGHPTRVHLLEPIYLLFLTSLEFRHPTLETLIQVISARARTQPVDPVSVPSRNGRYGNQHTTYHRRS